MNTYFTYSLIVSASRLCVSVIKIAHAPDIMMVTEARTWQMPVAILIYVLR